MPTLTSDNPAVIIVVVALILLLGGVGGGFIRGVMKDRRSSRVDDAALLDQVRDLVREEMAHMASQLRDERKRTGRLERRVDQLTDTCRRHGIPIPEWLPADPDPSSNN